MAAVVPVLAAVGGFLATYGGTVLTVASIGASIALQFLGPRGPGAEGPRLGDKKVSTSTYGEAIPLGFGRVRMAGNVIWATDIQEVPKKEGGKGGFGGGGGSLTTYSYFANFAIMFAEGPATSITRVWANSKVILDRTGLANQQEKYPTAGIRTYLGDSTQAPDPLVEADVGSGLTPAYRGRVYLVFEGLPLEDFGNGLPNIEAEVQFDAPVGTQSENLTSMNSWGVDQAAEMTNSGQLYGIRRHDLVSVDLTDSMFRYDLVDDSLEVNTGTDPFTGEHDLTGSFKSRHAMIPGLDGQLYAWGRDSSSGNRFLVRLNPFTLGLIGTWDLTSQFDVGAQDQDATAHYWEQVTPNGLEAFHFLSWNGDQGGFPDTDHNIWLLMRRRELVPSTTAGVYRVKFSMARGPVFVNAVADDLDGNLWLTGYAEGDASYGPTGDRQALLWKLIPTIIPDPTFGTDLLTAEVREYNLVELDPDGRIDQPQQMVYDAATNTLTIWGNDEPSPDTNERSVLQYSLDSGAVVNSRRFASTGEDNFRPDWFHGLPVNNPTHSYFRNGTDVEGKIPFFANAQWSEYDAANFTFTAGIGGPSIAGTISSVYWHQGSNSLFQWNGPSSESGGGTDPVRYFREHFTSTATDVGSVVKALVAEVGVADTQRETDAAMDAQGVDGYLVARPGSARDAIEPLGFAYPFDAVESDGKIKFVTRGGISTRTVGEDDLGANPGPSGEDDQLLTTRLMEVDLPEVVNVRFLDEGRDYQEGLEYARRMTYPNATQYSRSTIEQNLPIVMLPADAKAAAEAHLFNAWAARLGYELSLGPKHLDLDPTDTVTVQRAGKDDVVMRLTESELIEAFVSRLQAGTSEASVFTTVQPSATPDITPQVIALPGPTELFMLDIPYLRDIDSAGQANSGVYIAMSGQRSSWQAGFVTKSKAGIAGPFESFSASGGVHAWGYLDAAISALSDQNRNDVELSFPDKLTTWDDVTTISVAMVLGDSLLSSKTDLEVLNGANAAVIVDETEPDKFEVVQFANVDVSAGVATLSRLLRGRRGTEQHALAGWGLSARVVFLDTSTTRHEALPLDDLDAKRFYRVQTLGEPYDSSRLFDFTLRANDLRPYPVDPVLVDVAAGSRSASTITITWVRRTRLGAEDDLRDAVTEVPVSETVESYDVDLIDKGAETVSATKTTSADDTGVQFTVSERTTAGYTNDEAVRVKIYQNSGLASVGRGLVRDVTI